MRLRLIIDPNHPDALSHDTLVHATKLCPNLFELDLTFHGCGSGTFESVPVDGDEALDAGAASGAQRAALTTPSFSTETLHALRAGPRIRSLKLANWSDNDALALQLLDVWPSLNTLALKGTAPLLPVVPEEVDNPFRCSCKFAKVRLGLKTQPKIAFIDWLLGNSRETLQSFELEQETPIEFLNPLLKRYGPTLLSLALPSCTPREHVAAVTSHCLALREFRLGSASSLLSPLLFKQLSPKVEHLALPVACDSVLYPVLKYIGDRRNDKLRSVTVHLWGDAEAHPQLPSLKIACALRGIELRFVKSVWAFRTLLVS